MNFFFNKPKEKSGRSSGKKLEPGRDAVHVIVPPEDLLEKKPDTNPKPDTNLVELVRTTLESKAETTWYSHNSPLSPRSALMDDPLLSQKISVETGEFLRRIPSELLAEGPHDHGKQIEFNAGELMSNIRQRKPSVPLSSIARACPELFVSEISPELDAEIYFPWHSVVDSLSACCDQAGIKKKNPGIPEEPANPTARKTVNLKSKILPVDPEFDVSGESAATPESPEGEPTVSSVAANGIESQAPQSANREGPAETLVQERDLAIRQRDEALAEVERLKVALRHSSEALEAVCKTGVKEKDVD
jgi:hypothetical protein